MKINKAIDVLNQFRNDGCGVDEEDMDKALTLGIEALKRIKSGRNYGIAPNTKK